MDDNEYQTAVRAGMPTLGPVGPTWNEQTAEVSTGGGRTNDESISNGGLTEDETDETDQDDFESTYDFGNISTLDEANEAIASLRKQIK